MGDLAEGNGMQRAPVMPEAERAHRNLLDRALDRTDIDVLADPKSIVHQEEQTRDDVAHQGLGAEADRDAHDAGTGEQGADIDAEG